MYQILDDFVLTEFHLTEGMLNVRIVKSFKHYFVQYIPKRLIFVLPMILETLVPSISSVCPLVLHMLFPSYIATRYRYKLGANPKVF